MSRIDSSYQKIFHPLEGTAGESKWVKAKKVLKSIGLCAVTFGIMPLIVGSVKKHRDYKANKLNPNDLDHGSTASKTASKGGSTISSSDPKPYTPLTAHPSSPASSPQATTQPEPEKPEQPQAQESKPPITEPSTPSVLATLETLDPKKMKDEWSRKFNETLERGKAGDSNANFQLIIWKKEKRNVGGLEFNETEYKEIVDAAIKANNPEAMLLRIEDLYAKKQEVQSIVEIDKQIIALRASLEKLPDMVAGTAKAKLWAMRKVNGDGSKLKEAADNGNVEAQYQLGLTTGTRRGDQEQLMKAVEAGHPGALFYYAGLIDQGVVISVNPQEDMEPIYMQLMAEAASKGHMEAFAAILDGKREAKSTHPEEFSKWLEAGREMFTDDPRMLQD